MHRIEIKHGKADGESTVTVDGTELDVSEYAVEGGESGEYVTLTIPAEWIRLEYGD